MRALCLLALLLFAACTQNVKKNTTGNDQLLDSMISQLAVPLSQRDSSGARKTLDSLRPMATTNDDPRFMAYFNKSLGQLYVLEHKSDSALVLFKQVQAEGLKLKDSVLVGTTIIAEGFNYLQENKYDTALILMLEAYQYLQNSKGTDRIENIAFLAELFTRIGDNVNRRKYLFEGYKAANTPRSKAWFTNNIAVFYADNLRYDSAIKFLNEAVKDTNLVYPEHKAAQKENIGELYLTQAKYEQGLAALKEALDLYRQIDQVSEDTYINIAQAYQEMKSFSIAEAYLDSGIILAKIHNNPQMVSYLFTEKSKDHIETSQLGPALAFKDSAMLYHGMADSASVTKQSSDLETKYQVKAKDVQISYLDLSNRAAAKIAQQRTYVIIAIIIAALLIGVVAYLLYRRRQNSLTLRQYQLQQQLLRSQMEGHFVFNIMATLQSFIRQDQKEMAIEYLGNFVKLAQVSLVNARESFVPLYDEIEALRAYLNLQRIDLEEKLDFTIDLDEDYEEDPLLIPPMLLQPFVENAVVHGIRGSKQNGHISIKVTKSEHSIHVTIEDNGQGLGERKVEKKRPSLSTVITQERLELLGKQLGRPVMLKITDSKSLSGRGVKVEMVIPFTYGHARSVAG